MSITDSRTNPVLFTHIPLSRPDDINCGPLRERGTILPGIGLGYQNTLGKDATRFLLDNLRPSLIFRSGFSPALQMLFSMLI